MVGELTRDIKYSRGHDESILEPFRVADIFSRMHFLAKCLMHVLPLQAMSSFGSKKYNFRQSTCNNSVTNFERTDTECRAHDSFDCISTGNFFDIVFSIFNNILFQDRICGFLNQWHQLRQTRIKLNF